MISNHNPWLGLKSYEENNRIYGRDKETEELSNIIISSFHSIVYGKSGIGKTSLLKAGVFPVLRYEDFFPIYIRLEHDSAQGNGIKSYLEQIDNAINNPVQGVCINRKVDAEDINSLSDIFESYSIITTRGIDLVPVFIFDQFEEIFTLNERQNKNNITEFFRNLSEILNDNTIERNYRIVFCLREDYLYYIERYSETIPAFKRNRYSLQDLTRSEALEVITMPQKNFVDSACADEILQNLSNESTDQVNATILSLYMSRLYEIVAESGKASVTSDIIHQFGENIIESFYFDSIKSISEKSVAYLEDHLLTGEGFRHHVTYNDAISSGVKPEEIGTLINSRVLTKDSRNGHEYIEFSHDVIAPIAKKHRDEHKLRENARKAKRRMWGMVGFVSLLMVVIAVFIVMLLIVRDQKNKITQSLYSSLSNQTYQLVDNGETLLAMRLLVNILDEDPTNVDAEKALRALCDSIESQDYPILLNIKVRDTWGDNPFCIVDEGKYFIVSSVNHCFYLINTRNGKIERIVQNPYSVSGWMYATKDGKQIITVDRDKQLRIWSYPDFALETEFSFGEMQSMDVSVNESLGQLAIHKRLEDHRYENFVFDINRREVIKSLDEDYTSLQFSNDGKLLAAVYSIQTSILSACSNIDIYETEKYEEINSYSSPGRVYNICFSHNDSLMAFGKYKLLRVNQFSVIDTSTGNELFASHKTSYGIFNLVFSYDDSKLLVATQSFHEQECEIYDLCNMDSITSTIVPKKIRESEEFLFLNKENDLVSQKAAGSIIVRQHTNKVPRFSEVHKNKVDDSSDELSSSINKTDFLRRPLYETHVLGGIEFVENKDNNKIIKIEIPDEKAEKYAFLRDTEGYVESCCLSPDSMHFAIFMNNGNFYFYNLEGETKYQHTFDGCLFRKCLFNRKGNLLSFSVSEKKENSCGVGLYLLNVDDNSLHIISDSIVDDFNFSPDGTLIFSTIDGQLRIWNTNTLTLVKTTHQIDCGTYAVTPLSDNRVILTTRNGIVVYDWKTSNVLAWLDCIGDKFCIDNDERYMVVLDGELNIYDLRTYTSIYNIPLNEIKERGWYNDFAGVEFSEDGTQIYLDKYNGNVYKCEFPRLQTLIDRCKLRLEDWSLTDAEKERFNLNN